MKRTFYLSPQTYYYNYAIEGTCHLSLAFPKGMYCKAHSIKQAFVYFKRRIAIYDMCDMYDIDFPISDIKIIEENNSEQIPRDTE